MLHLIASFAACAASAPALTIEAASHPRQIVLRTAAIELPAAEDGAGHGYHGHLVTPLIPFAWPTDGWARGFRLRLLDCAGNELAKTRLHHAVVLHLEQRELMYPIYRRLLAFTPEAEDLMLPRGVGLPLKAGAQLGLLAAWTPVAEQPERVILEITISYLGANANPRPVPVVPLGLDVNYEPGGGASFDLPVGRSIQERMFELPLEGRVLVAGAHLHDYATSLVLSDAASGKPLIEIRPRLDPRGRLLGVERKVYGASGAGLKLRAGRRYRLVVIYDNPSGVPIAQGGMGILAGLFNPEDLSKWPALDKGDPTFQLDVAMLTKNGFLPELRLAP